MIVFIQSNHRKKGIDRFLESFLLIEECEIVYANTIEDTNKYETESGIFGGFLPRDLRKSTIKNKYYVFCSPFGQADLSGPDFYSPEIQILMELKYYLNNKEIKNVITPSKSVANRFGFIYVVPVKKNFKRDFCRERKNYGFLGNNFRKHKNVANQIAAISELDPKEKIIVNNKLAYKGWEKLFDCEFESKNLVSDEDYYNEIKTHRLCFQCSFSESFDYLALEYCLMGVPVICSSSVDWVPPFRAKNDYFLVPQIYNTDCYSDIALGAQWILDNDYWEYSEFLYDWAFKFNEKNKMDFINTFGKL